MSIDDLEFLANEMSAGSVSIGDWETLVHYARGKDIVVELGTNIGSTAIVLAAVAKSVFTIDVFENLSLIKNEKQREMYRNHWNSNRHTLRDIAEKLRFYAINVAIGLSDEYAFHFCDSDVDFIFIDADHSYEGVKADYAAWYSKVKTGGFFAFHDVGPGCEVFDFYNNELLKDDRIELMPDVATGPCWTKVFRKKGV